MVFLEMRAARRERIIAIVLPVADATQNRSVCDAQAVHAVGIGSSPLQRFKYSARIFCNIFIITSSVHLQLCLLATLVYTISAVRSGCEAFRSPSRVGKWDLRIRC
jgi:hypothetical protein